MRRDEARRDQTRREVGLFPLSFVFLCVGGLVMSFLGRHFFVLGGDGLRTDMYKVL